MDSEPPIIKKSEPPKNDLFKQLNLNLKQKGSKNIISKFLEQQKKSTEGFQKEFFLVPADINLPIGDEEDEDKGDKDQSQKNDGDKEDEKNLLGQEEGKEAEGSKIDSYKTRARKLLFKVLDFKKGAKFFTYETEGFEQFEDDLGQPAKKNVSWFNKGKIILQVLIAICLFILILYNYLQILGSEKSQSLKYTMHSNLSYPLDQVPRLLPAHQFIFIEQESVEKRMECKIYDNQDECQKIEELRCNAKGTTTEAFEVCMINLNNLLSLNATQFCVDHYAKEEMKVDSLDPSMPWYWQRLHGCYENTGVPKGRAYCDDMQLYQVPAWTQDQLFNCYRKNNVDFAKEYCEALFANQDSDDEDAVEKLLQCYGTQGVTKGKEYCDSNFKGDSRVEIKDRIDCYDNNDVTSKQVCDDKKAFYYWADSKLQNCYKAEGYTLNKDFCVSFFPLISQLDERYECFNTIGLDIVKDRTYCELKYPDNIQNKFNCIDTELDLDPIPKKGGDYCYIQYKWFDEYGDADDPNPGLYKCLAEQGFEKDSTYCNMEAYYKEFTSTNGLEGVDLQDKLKEISDEKWTCQKPFFDPENQLEWNDSINCTIVQAIIDEQDETISQIELTLNEASKMTPEPEQISNTGDYTMIQQSYFLGGAIKFFDNSVENQDIASYIVIGNYPSTEAQNWEQYGKLIFVKNANRDLLSTESNSRRRNLQEINHEKSKQMKRHLEGVTIASNTLIPNIDKDFGDVLNFIDEREYNNQLIKMIEDGTLTSDDYEIGEWYFSHANKIEVNYPDSNKKFSMTFDYDQNQVNIESSSNADGFPLTMSFDNSVNTLQTVVVQNWGQNIQEKMFALMKDGSVKPNMDCQFVGDESSTTSWQYDFGEEQQIQTIELFNFQNGVKPSLLQGAKIYIGTTLCATLSDNPPPNEVLKINCKDQSAGAVQVNIFSSDYTPDDKYEGTKGSFIKIVPASPGIMSICDIKAFAKNKETNDPAAVTYCEDWRAQCNELTNDEDKDNCLERFGQKKQPDSCLNLRPAQVSTTEPKFYYPLKRKYECLANHHKEFDKITLDFAVYDCLALYYMYAVEQCLQVYERTYNNMMDFKGSPNIYSEYGNTGVDIVAQREQQRLDELQSDLLASTGFSLQVPLEQVDREFNNDDLQQYLCDRVNMFFYTNPFNDASISENPQNEITWNMKCEVFSWMDVAIHENMHTVLHFYIDSDMTNVTDSVTLEDIKDLMFINGTELNNQYFELQYDKELQFLEVVKSELYIREQDPQAEEVNVPLMEGDGTLFDEFRANASSVRVVETSAQVIGVDYIDDTTLDCLPRTNTYNGIPKRFGLEFLGFPLEFTTFSDRIILVFQELTERLTEKYSDEEREMDKFPVRVSLRVSFTEESFNFLYYSLMDLVSEVGGLGGAVAGTLGQFSVYIMMLFVVDLIMIIKRKYKNQKRVHNLQVLGKKLPLFKKIVLSKIDSMTKEKENHESSESDPDTDSDEGLGAEERRQKKKETRLRKKTKEAITKDIELAQQDLATITKLQKEFKVDEAIYSEQVKQEDKKEEEEEDEDTDDRDPDLILDEQEEDLLMLDNKYKQEYKDFYTRDQKDIFDELNVTKKLLNERVKYSFMHIVELVKKRVSFFGIYSLCDQIDITTEKMNHLRLQLDKKSRLLLEHQNQLRTNFNTLHKKIDPDAIEVDGEDKKKPEGERLPGILDHLKKVPS